MMAFDKNLQRARAAEVEFQMLAKGVQKPVLPPPPMSQKTPQAWPFTPQAAVAARAQTQPITAVQHRLKTKKEPKMAVNYSAEPFTNSLGQTIQPGQKVICVSQGYNHTTKVALGEYLGLRRDSRGGVRNVVVSRTEQKSGYQLNGKSASYKTPGATYGKYTHTGKTSLPSKRIYPTV
jgi:hypothetical protein